MHNPERYLHALHRKYKWKTPVYKKVSETKKPYVLIKVILNGTAYQPQEPSDNEKEAKEKAALHCLKALGYIRN